MKILMLECIHGSDIVAEIDEKNSTDKEWALVDPLRYIVRPHPQNPQGLQETFTDLGAYADDSEGADRIKLNRDHVFISYPPKKRIRDNYINAVKNMRTQKSGLVLPQKPGLSL